jgi:hypothetical protein
MNDFMKRNLLSLLLCNSVLLLSQTGSYAQITLLKDYKNNTSATVGSYQGITVREAGFSALRYIPGTEGKEFWTCSDRGPNVDAASANPSGCAPTYDKIFPFPSYSPKIHRIRINGDSIQILRTITIKNPNGVAATGKMNPTGLGSTSTELVSTDTVLNCANFNIKTAPKDTFGIDCEAIAVDKDGYFWLAEEGGPSIWKLDQNGRLIKRYTPYANLGGAQAVDVAIDTVFKYRKNNRGFENMTIAPNGKIYALIQSPLLYPDQTTGENTRIHRLLELDPNTGVMRQFAYLNDGVIGTGSNQIRLKDWKLGEITAINDSTFLVLEAAARGTTDIKKMYKININGATAVTSGFVYGGLSLEALIDSTGLAGKNITAVKKTLVMDLLANNWPSAYDKAEGLAIIDDSTIAICNDNDYGVSSPAANGIVTATGTLSHLVTYRLAGTNKLSNFVPLAVTLDQGRSSISSSQAPYITPTIPVAWYKSIITTTDLSGNYMMAGLPDGLGAFDNNNGTFTVLMNHEFGNTQGATHAYGSLGAFVSKWVINKSDLSVVSGQDLTQKMYLWNTLTQSFVAYNAASPSTLAAFSRFCSADLPAVSAFYNSTTGKGTPERIFMNGEESGDEGRAVAHIATGPNAGSSYELPWVGKFSHENEVANPATGDKTVVAGMDDATPGQVYFYIGTKTSGSGTEIEKAGLTNGKLYSPAVSGMLTETSASIPAAGTSFSMIDLGNVQNMTGAQLEAASNTAGVTRFLRPEDGAWDPQNPNDFYFNTTNAFNAPSRVWKLHFTDINDLTVGGTITAVLDGTEGQQMLDNMTIDNYGHIVLVEDVGNNAWVGRVLQYDIATDILKTIGRHDTTRFLNGGANFLTQDEEASGPIDVQNILGAGMFLTVTQDHHAISGAAVEGGQLMAFFNPDTYNANPEISLEGNSTLIVDGDVTPATADNTDFGNVNKGTGSTKSFVIKNAGPGSLIVKGISFTGANASEFTLTGSVSFPLTINANASQTINVQFMPTALGVRTAILNVRSNDFDEDVYDVAIQGNGTTPAIKVQGNSIDINDGDLTAGAANNTDFGTVNIGANITKTFTIKNNGTGSLSVSGISFSGANASEFTLVSAPTFPLSINASASQAITVQFAPTAIGTRTAIVNIANDDPAVTTYDFAVEGTGVLPSGISSVAALSAVKLYPNPTANSTTLSLTIQKDVRVVISVTDIQGKQAMAVVEKEMKTGEQKITLNTSELNSGVYFVQIISGSEVVKLKMIVNH